jgi:putative ABC transport system permease protein
MILYAIIGIVAAILAALLGVNLHDAIRRPGMRRQAFRNLNRRRGEAVLVTVGSLLGTAIICGSLLVGATFRASIRDGARTTLGPIDETVSVTGLGNFDAVKKAVDAEPIPGADGTLTAVTAPVTVATAGSSRTAEPQATALGVDFDAARHFGGDVKATGLRDAGPTPSGHDVVIGHKLAQKLHVHAGQALDLYMFGHEQRVTIRTIVPELGVAGSADVFVPPGAIDELAATSRAPTATPPKGLVFVSNDGGVFSGANGSSAVRKVLEERTAGIAGVEVATSKKDLLADAEAQGRSIGQLFTTVGVFSVLAGVLLLVNLFIMLAEERKRDLGMLRALGMSRNHLMRTFALEGVSYALAAALFGMAAGVAVGWGIVEFTRSIFRNNTDAFTLRFTVPADQLVLGAAIGLVISLVTVWATSARIGRLNVIRAIRDVPEPPRRGTRWRSFGLGVFGASVGGLATAVGVIFNIPAPTILGPALAFLCAIPVVRRVAGRRTTVIALSLAVLAWSIGVFSWFPGATRNTDVAVFVVQGVVMVGAAVAIASSSDRFWAWLTEHLSRTGKGLAARLGLAYPLARSFRTGMLLGMYALIVFTLAFLAVFSSIFSAQAGAFTRQVDAGTDLVVDTNPASPITIGQLRAQPQVADVAPLVLSGPDFTAPFEKTPTQWGLTGFDESLLNHGTPTLSDRAPGYTSDRAVFEAVLHDPNLIIVDGQFLTGTSQQPGSNKVLIGDHVTAIDPATAAKHSFTVVGLVSHDVLQNGSFASESAVRSLMGELAVTARFYVTLTPGASPLRVADQLDAALISHGVDASTFRSKVDDSIAVELGFLTLMQGYLALGLVIGVAGLGVVMVRAVRERRRQIGMLRAMGFAAGVVRRAFLTEAGFVAVQGIVIGIALGLVTSYQMLTNSTTFGGERLPYHVPWASLGLLAVIPLLASLAAAVLPASQAASVRPAVALRLTE